MKIAHIAPPWIEIPPKNYGGTEIVLYNHDLIERYVREFLGRNLRQEKTPLLDSVNNSVGEATVQRYGH